MTQLFPRVAPTHRGYHTGQVDEFFARARAAYEELGNQHGEQDGNAGGEVIDADTVRSAAFDLVRRGYRAASVDAALDRLEAAFVAARRADFIAEKGRSAWMGTVVDRATTLYERLTRPAGQRFAPPERGRGYAAADVDALLERVVAYFDEGAALSAAEVRTAVFSSASGADAYAEGPVDAYLDRVVDVLLAVE